MHRLLSPGLHAVIDYLVVAAFLVAPAFFGFTGAAATLCFALSAVHLAMSLLTDSPGGLARKLPFPIHGTIESLVVPFLVIAPYLFGFERQFTARVFFMSAGVALALVFLATNYRAVDSKWMPALNRRHRAIAVRGGRPLRQS